MTKPKSTATPDWQLVADLTTDGAWVPRLYVLMCGRDTTTALMLHGIVFWTRKQKGEFYKRHGADEGRGWEDDTGLSERQTIHSAKKLRAMGLISTRVGHGHDNKPAVYYQLNRDEFVQHLLEAAAAHEVHE